MLSDFSEYFRLAYLEPLPKRLAVISFFLLCYFVIMHFSSIQQLGKLISRVKTLRVLTAIVIFAFFLRLTWCLISPTRFATQYGDLTSPIDESSLINIHSQQIAKGGVPLNEDGTLATRRPVGYLYLLGGLYYLFGYQKDLFKVVQILLGCLLVLVSFFLAKSIFQNNSVALISAFLMAIYPENLFSVNIPLDEYPFFVCWFAALYLIAENIRKKAVSHTILIAALIGVATAFRTHTFFMPLILFIVYLFNRLPFRKATIQMMVSFVVIYLVSAPWGWTTFKHYGSPSFFSTAGIYFYGTLNDHATWQNGFLPATIEDGGNLEFINETNPVKKAQIGTKLAMKWVIDNPTKALQWFGMRNAMLYGFDLSDEISDLNMAHASDSSSFSVQRHHKIRKLKNWAYSFAAFCGFFGSLILIFDRRHLFWKKYTPFLLLIFIFIYWCTIHGFFFGFRKYRWVIDLFLLFPASFFLWWLAQLPLWIKPASTTMRHAS